MHRVLSALLALGLLAPAVARAQSDDVTYCAKLADLYRHHIGDMGLGIEPVAQRLLVEAGLRLAFGIAVERPEARAVGRHHLVDQQDLARYGPAKLELGVGDDDALLKRDIAAPRIDEARQPLELGS